MKIGFLLASLLFSPALIAQDVTPVTTRQDVDGERLNRWFAEGSAAGLVGIRYDNRDAGHSRLDLGPYPQLTPLTYSEAQLAEKKDYGPPEVIHPFPVLGNASLSGPAVGGASIPRLFFGKRDGLAFLTNQYLGNQLYVFPEHEDHDPQFGDLYAVNSPFLLISQGSSGSDLPLLEAVAMTVASFSPEVRRFLERQKLLMPVVQQILRSSQKTVRVREDYLTVAAHPTAFPAEWIDVAKMMDRAHAMTIATLPPLIQIETVAATEAPRPGIDFFESTEFQSETLSERGFVIARVFRGMSRERELTARVTGIREWSGRPLQIHWRLLRGNPELVTITRSDSSPEATIRVQWHGKPADAPAFPKPIAGHRVEIGVFADDGINYSPPCFITFHFLSNERRRYDDEGRIQETDYRFDGSFTDITLTSEKPWRDVYHYDKNGKPTGWTREEENKAAVQFDAGGRMMRDGKAVPVRYEVDEATKHLHAVGAGGE